tara:strand:- start:6465 stop:6683 length:219 start_codon:yes stop_codon:yes gene_type:complete
MAIRKHALTKEGAIVAITRKQLKDMGKETEIQKKFVELYMLESDERIAETYRLEFGTELVIVKNIKNEKSKK